MMTSIDQNPQWLLWDAAHQASYAQLRQEYLDTVAQGIGRSLASLVQHGHSRAAALISDWEQLSEAEARRIVAGPSTSFHVFFLEQRFELFAEFLSRAIAAERCRAGTQRSPSDGEIWSASGDFVRRGAAPSPLVPEVERRLQWHAPCVDDGLVVDFRSPEATGILLGADHPQMTTDELRERIASRAIALFSIDEEEVLRATLQRTFGRIRAVNAHVASVVNSFTLALVVRCDVDQPERFTSGSTGQFVGRTCLINPTAPGVDDAILADALIHEAIHSVLYMQERRRPWVTNRDVYFGHGYIVRSPWTGRALTPRQFMQACFVWYGLYHFWSLPGAAAAFGESRATRLAADAREGFYGIRLTDLAAPFSMHTDPVLLETLDVLQRCVLSNDFPMLSGAC